MFTYQELENRISVLQTEKQSVVATLQVITDALEVEKQDKSGLQDTLVKVLHHTLFYLYCEHT